jgi:hypothetical protein
MRVTTETEKADFLLGKLGRTDVNITCVPEQEQESNTVDHFAKIMV